MILTVFALCCARRPLVARFVSYPQPEVYQPRKRNGRMHCQTKHSIIVRKHCIEDRDCNLRGMIYRVTSRRCLSCRGRGALWHTGTAEVAEAVQSVLHQRLYPVASIPPGVKPFPRAFVHAAACRSTSGVAVFHHWNRMLIRPETTTHVQPQPPPVSSLPCAASRSP